MYGIYALLLLYFNVTCLSVKLRPAVVYRQAHCFNEITNAELRPSKSLSVQVLWNQRDEFRTRCMRSGGVHYG